MEIVTVTVRRSAGFEFELRYRVIERRAKLHATSSQVRIQRASGGIERPLALRPGAEPAEPVEHAAVRGTGVVTEAMSGVVVPIHLRCETELMKVARALDALRRVSTARKRRQQHRRQYRNDGDDHEEFDEGEAKQRSADSFVREPRASGSRGHGCPRSDESGQVGKWESEKPRGK